MKKRAAVVGTVCVAAVALLALTGTAGANHAFFQHLSDGEINGNGAFNADFQGASADGARVFFNTDELLVAADDDVSQDVYERSGGTTKLVSAGAINGNGAFNASFRGASADGKRVFFDTFEPLVAADTDDSLDVYERSAGQTKLVSAGQINGNGPFEPAFRGASADGTRVFFVTFERLVGGDTDSVKDLYQRSGGTTKRVSAGQINGNGGLDADFTGASADGSRVFFATDERLVAGDTDSVQDVYERSAGTTKLISAGQINGNGDFSATFQRASANGARVFFTTSERLASADADSSQDVYERFGGTTTRISSGNGAFNAFFRGASADGTRVFFETSERLVGGDTDGFTDVYERSGGTTKRVSAGAINGNGNFNPFFQGASADGARVLFETEEQLVAADADSSEDIYERVSGTTKLVSAGQINGNGPFEPAFGGASADGSRVFFATNERLVGGDNDASFDVYERSAGTTSKVSRGNGAFGAAFLGASADGSAVFFATFEGVIAGDDDAQVDVYGAYVAP